MNRTHIVLFTLLVAGAVLVGTASAGIVSSDDLRFIAGSPAVSTGAGAPDVWGSAGIISQADYDFVTREGGPDTGALIQKPADVATVEGADYRLIAGDGTPGATCDIALVAAIHSGC